MKHKLLFVLFMMFGLLLCAQQVADVRIAQNIRFDGNVAQTSSNESWVLWDDNPSEGYQIRAQKYDSLGTPMFGNPITIPTAGGSIKLLQTVATTDNSIVLLFMHEVEPGVPVLRVQKLNPAGQPVWQEYGIIVAGVRDLKFPSVEICANNLGGAFVVHEIEYQQGAMVFGSKNYDASGNNIWTAAANFSANDVWDINQLLLTDAGNLLISFNKPEASYIRQVDNSGNIIGADPLFPPAAVIPPNTRMAKGTAGKILFYSDGRYSNNPLQVQLMDASGNLLFSTLKEISIPINQWWIGEMKGLPDGGFVLPFICHDGNYWYGGNELRIQRIDANLDPVWGAETLLLSSDGSSIVSIDAQIDPLGNTWIGFNSVDNNNSNAKVRLLKIDPSGNSVFGTLVLSTNIQDKYMPKLALLNNNVMFYWGDKHDDSISLRRQIITPSGALLLADADTQISSRLSGVGSIYGVYSIGQRSICLMHDNRGANQQIYYQILDSNMNQYLQPNGKALDTTDHLTQTILSAKVNPDNSLGILYYKYEGSGTFSCYLQEIDAAGNQAYPGSGIHITTMGEIPSTAISYDANSRYVFWTMPASPGSFHTQLMGQRFINGVKMWEEDGRVLYDHDDQHLTYIHAEERYLVLELMLIGQNRDETRAIRIQASGALELGWNPEGIPVLNTATDNYFQRLQQTGMIGNDFYCFIMNYEPTGLFVRGQKIDPAGNLPWGEAGLILNEELQFEYPDLRSAIFSDHISLLYHQEGTGSFLQKLDTDGNKTFGEYGIVLPGTTESSYGSRLVEYDNDTFSYFRIESTFDYTTNLLHSYVNSNGSIQDTQILCSDVDYQVYTVNCDNSALLYWGRYDNDLFAWEGGHLISLYARALPEPITVSDITAEQVPMISLSQNFPNPFKESTRISYKLRDAGAVELDVFNIKGQLVKQLQMPQKAAGNHEIDWDGRDSRGKRCAGGIYFYKVKSGRFSAGKKMILLR